MPCRASALIELIGINEQVDQNDFGGSVALPLGTTGPGEILSVLLRTTESDAGSILTPEGTLIFLNADPAVSAGDTSMTAAEWATVVGSISVSSSDWVADANAGVVLQVPEHPIPFESLSDLYMVWLHEDATSFNDGGTDDEALHVVVRFKTG